MKVEVKIPEVGESVQEAVLAQWYKRDGDRVETDEILFVIETDKVTLEVTARAGGVLSIMVPEGTTVTVGTVVGVIDTEAAPSARAEKPPREREPQEALGMAQEKVGAKESGPPTGARASTRAEEAQRQQIPPEEAELQNVIMPPSVRRLVAEKNIDISKVAGTGPGGRLTKGDVLEYLEKSSARPAAAMPAPDRWGPEPAVSREGERIGAAPRQATGHKEEIGHTEGGKDPDAPRSGDDRGEATTRKPMSPIRRRIAERLLQAKQNTAMLTTFNEIDMSHVQAVRAQFKESFKAEYGVSLGIMSFFIKAAIEALREYPEVNASIDGNEIVYHHYHHIGVAVGSERGLVVPVIRHPDRMSFAEIERAIVDYVEKIKENRLELSDLEGGTFTISNGGIYGSLLSTPILNMPQSGILGMHKIEDRPVAVNSQVVIRPMMYVALSYDHRIIDGRGAVSFLKRIKECVEDPERIMLEI
jgi:2-oxoglutarate dehydrogenase E2 component (dihydrolipoamide succinyltransferase)